MPKMFLVCMFIITSLLALQNAQGVIFPIAFLLIMFRVRIQQYVMRFNAGVTFIGVGILLGLITEMCAILSNSGLADDKKILLHPDPLLDLLIGSFYYSFVIVTWYLLLRRYNFQKKVVFALSGLLGILTEQSGAIFLGLLTNPLLGIPMAMIIACVYGIFPTLAYTFSEQKFSMTRIIPKWRHYALAVCAIFFQWAFFGNIVYPIFIEIFPK